MTACKTPHFETNPYGDFPKILHIILYSIFHPWWLPHMASHIARLNQSSKLVFNSLTSSFLQLENSMWPRLLFLALLVFVWMVPQLLRRLMKMSNVPGYERFSGAKSCTRQGSNGIPMKHHNNTIMGIYVYIYIIIIWHSKGIMIMEFL